jgi:intein/homing endonuclease
MLAQSMLAGYALFRPPPSPTVRNGFQFSSTHAVQCLQRYGLVQGAKVKRVPGWVFGLRRELRLGFLAGLVDTDGSIDRRGTLKIQLANRPLVEDVKALLVGCGIQTSNLYHQIFDAAVLPNAGLKDHYESWAIVCSSAEEVATIPFVDSLYRTRVQANAGRRRRGGKDATKAGLDDCLGFYTVRSIAPEGVEPVYYPEVDGGHAFIADGLVLQFSTLHRPHRRVRDLARAAAGCADSRRPAASQSP